MPYVNPPAGSTLPPGTTATSQVTSDLASGGSSDSSYLSQLAGTLLGQYGTTIAGAQQSSAEAARTAALLNPALAVNSQNLIATKGYSIANALLGEQGVQVAGETIAAKEQAAGQQQGIELGEYGVTSTRFPEEQAQAALTFKNKQLSQQSSAAGSGTLNTQGSQQAQQTNAQEYGFQQQTIYRQQALSQLSQQAEQVGYGLTQEQLANSQQQLALTGQRQGLGLQQTIQQLGYGLSQLGISSTPVKYYAAMQTAQGTEATAYKAALGQASLLGGIGPIG